MRKINRLRVETLVMRLTNVLGHLLIDVSHKLINSTRGKPRTQTLTKRSDTLNILIPVIHVRSESYTQDCPYSKSRLCVF